MNNFIGGTNITYKYKPEVITENAQPKISIIVTAWNNILYLEECLDSILNQNFDIEYEILLGIDGCKKTKNKFIELRKNKPKYNKIKALYMNKNMGTYVTTNTLIKESKSNIILRFDSDDIMRKNMLHIVYNQFTNDLDLLKFRCDSFENDININKPLKTNPDGVCAFSRRIYNETGGYKNWRCAADSDYLIRVSFITKKIKKINNSLFLRREHPESLTHQKETNFNSELRNEYRKMIAKKFEKIEPIINTFTVI